MNTQLTVSILLDYMGQFFVSKVTDVCPDGSSCFCTAEMKAVSKKQYVQNQDQNPE